MQVPGLKSQLIGTSLQKYSTQEEDKTDIGMLGMREARDTPNGEGFGVTPVRYHCQHPGIHSSKHAVAT